MVDRDLRNAERSQDPLRLYNQFRRSGQLLEARRTLEDAAREGNERALELLKQEYPLPLEFVEQNDHRVNMRDEEALLITGGSLDPRLQNYFAKLYEAPANNLRLVIPHAPTLRELEAVSKRWEWAVKHQNWSLLSLAALLPAEAARLLQILEENWQAPTPFTPEHAMNRLHAAWLAQQALPSAQAKPKIDAIFKDWPESFQPSDAIWRLDWQALDQGPHRPPWIPTALSPGFMREPDFALSARLVATYQHMNRFMMVRQRGYLHHQRRDLVKHHWLHFFGVITPRDCDLPKLQEGVRRTVRWLQDQIGDWIFSGQSGVFLFHPELDPDFTEAIFQQAVTIFDQLFQSSSDRIQIGLRATVVHTGEDPGIAFHRAQQALGRDYYNRVDKLLVLD